MKSNFFLIGMSIITGILLAEAVLWIFFRVPEVDGHYRNVAVRQNANIPGLKEHIIYDENLFGFRSLSMDTLQKPSNTIRIICLGHSTTLQPIQDTKDIWSAILEKELQEKFSPKIIRIEVAARGKGGQGIKQTLSWARENILNYQPDLVILLEGVDDLCWRQYGKYVHVPDIVSKVNLNKNKNNLLWEVFLLRVSQIYRRLQILEHKFELYELIKKGAALEWHSKNLPNLRKYYRDLPYVLNPRLDLKQTTEFSENLTALLVFLRRANVSVIVLGQPVIWKSRMSADEINAIWFPVETLDGNVRPSTEWLENEMTVYNNIQKNIALKLYVPYVDLDKKIPKNLQYFFDDCHFTDLGNIKVANEIFSVVEKQVEYILDSKKKQKMPVR